jgi:hypothetical protein
MKVGGRWDEGRREDLMMVKEESEELASSFNSTSNFNNKPQKSQLSTFKAVMKIDVKRIGLKLTAPCPSEARARDAA